MILELSVGSASLKGRRASNQDALLAMPARGVFAVADGVGGQPGGDTAAWHTVDVLRERADAGRLSKPHEGLSETFLSAQQRLCRSASGENRHMATTLVAACIHNDVAMIAHVGDSRAYLQRGRKLTQLTRDHTLACEWRMAVGVNAPPPSRAKNTLTRAVGVTMDATPDVSRATLRSGDVLCLCSDGVWGPLGPERIGRILRLSAARAAHELVHRAIANGGKDNATAVVVRMNAYG